MSAERLIHPDDMLDFIWALVFKAPLIARVAVLHMLGLTEPSKYVDLRTELTMTVLRIFLAPSNPRSVTETQKLTTQDPPVKGQIWVSKYASPAPPETSMRDSLVKVIEALQHPSTEKAETGLPDMVPVEAEWTGHRDEAAPNSRLPDISEADKYDEMMKECKSPATVLYFHGGAYWLLDPSTHRKLTSDLARRAGGRCYSVRYRLAPQNPFPAALLDALASYLTLLYPPPEAFHEPVSPEHIVFAGDRYVYTYMRWHSHSRCCFSRQLTEDYPPSAGGSLCMALLQTLLELRRQKMRITWFGAERDIPLPAGVAVNSPWMDPTVSSPSYQTNAAYDYIPSPNETDTSIISGADASKRPSCPAWPADPPRNNLYADDALMPHPLVALVAAPSWAGAPPVYICTGRELLRDEDCFAAAKLHRDGVAVVFEEYEGMPHCFAMALDHLGGAKRCMKGWAEFISRAVERPESISSSFTLIKAKTLQEVPIAAADVAPYTEEFIRDKIEKKFYGKS